MPEWYIQRIQIFPRHNNTPSLTGKYYVEVFPQTWELFKMDGKLAKNKISRLLNLEGKAMITFGEDIVFECHDVGYSFSYKNIHDYYVNAMIIPDEFVKSYGIREGDYLDFTLQSVYDPSDKKTQEIFPKRLVTGTVLIQPSGDRIIPLSRMTDIFVEQSLKEEFFVKLIQEINDAYSYELYRSTHILLRTLFENLVFKLLKKKFPQDDSVYLTKKGYALEFSKLIDNLKEKRHEFTLYAKLLDDDFFSFLDEFREKANASTHILEVYLDKPKIDKDKNKINHYIKILDHITTEIN